MKLTSHRSPTRLSSLARLGVCAIALLLATPAFGAKVVDVRVGLHKKFTRVVFETDTPSRYRIEHAPDGSLQIHLSASSAPKRVSSKSPVLQTLVVKPDPRGSVAKLDLRGKPGQVKEMLLAKPPRIVIDLTHGAAPVKKKGSATGTAAKKPTPKPSASKPTKPSATTQASKPPATTQATKPTATKPPAAQPGTKTSQATRPKTAATEPTRSGADTKIDDARVAELARKLSIGQKPPGSITPSDAQRDEAVKRAVGETAPGGSGSVADARKAAEAAIAKTAEAAEAGTKSGQAAASAMAERAAESASKAQDALAKRTAAGASAATDKARTTAGAAADKTRAAADKTRAAAGSAADAARRKLGEARRTVTHPSGAAGTTGSYASRPKPPGTTRPPAARPTPTPSGSSRTAATLKPADPATHPDDDGAGEGGGFLPGFLKSPIGLAGVGAIFVAGILFFAMRGRRNRDAAPDFFPDPADDEPFSLDDSSSALADATSSATAAAMESTPPETAPASFQDDGIEIPDDDDKPDEARETATMDQGMDSVMEPGLSPPPAMGGNADVMRMFEELERRVTRLEKQLEETSEAKERLERQVAAQTEELRVQRSAIARTQRALRSMARPNDEATEPVPKG